LLEVFGVLLLALTGCETVMMKISARSQGRKGI